MSLVDLCLLLKPRCLSKNWKAHILPSTSSPQTHPSHCRPREKARTPESTVATSSPCSTPGAPDFSSSHTPWSGSQMHLNSPGAKDIDCKSGRARTHTHTYIHPHTRAEVGAEVGGECSMLMKELGCSGSKVSLIHQDKSGGLCQPPAHRRNT